MSALESAGPRPARFAARHAAFAAAVATVAVFPLLSHDPYLIGIGIFIGAMAAGTVGFVLLMGYAQQLALGQAAFCMVGGYATAILVTRHAWDSLSAMLAGAALAMLIAYLIGKPVLRLSGLMLAMASLALQLMMITLAREFAFTGQALGISGVPKFSLLGLPLTSDTAYYFLVWAIVLAFVIVGFNIERSRHGRALKAIATSEIAAASVGVDTARSKLQMFVISAGMASVSGSLIVHYLRIMEPSIFDFAYSLNIITAVVAGGLASVWGGVLGATLFVAVRELVRGLGIAYLETVLMAVLTCVVLIAFPRGLAGLISDFWRRLAGAGTGDEAGTQDSSPAPSRPGDGALSATNAVPPANAPALEVRGVSRSFGALHAVQDVSFTVASGSITALIGPNGAGKTTLFNLVCGFEPLDGGEILFGDRAVSRATPERIANLGMARTFQTPWLFTNMSVLENAMCGTQRQYRGGILAASFRTPRVRAEEREARQAAFDALRIVGLDHLASRSPGELAFGQQRSLEIARAIAMKPSLLLMDEPASGLNDAETEGLAKLLLRINAGGITVLLIEHDLRIVMGLADQIVVLDQGQKIADGPPNLVRASPRVIEAYLGKHPPA